MNGTQVGGLDLAIQMGRIVEELKPYRCLLEGDQEKEELGDRGIQRGCCRQVYLEVWAVRKVWEGLGLAVQYCR